MPDSAACASSRLLPQPSCLGADQVPSRPQGAIIGIGSSCFVSIRDSLTVLKGYEIWVDGKRRSYFPRPCEEALRREQLVYEKIGPHPQILQCFGLEEVHPGVHSLRLEVAPLGNVRQYIEEHADEPLPQYNRLHMALDVAVGLSHVHSRKVQHADLSCRNLFLFDDLHVKIGDFGGSVVEGYGFAETVCEEMRYELPLRGREFSDRPVMKRELFALGSAIYEIMAWSKPYPEAHEDEVEKRYARDEFPCLGERGIDDIIWNCWNEVFETADEVALSLKTFLAMRQPVDRPSESRSLRTKNKER